MGEPVRKETRHIEYPGAAWMSFDRYSRYAAIARALRANRPDGRLRVLDVGDSSGYLSTFDDELDLVTLDLYTEPEPLGEAHRIIGDGADLPFGDTAVDAVVSADALEHISPDRRSAFIAELARVAADLVVMAAPFDTPGVAGAEELVRRYVIFSTRSEQPQLEEHREYGLPGLEETRTRLADHGLEVGTWGNGNLHDWLAMMLTKHVLEVDHAFAPMEAGTDVLYNYVFSAREFVPPFYRHLIVGRRGETPAIPAAPERTEGDSDATAVLGAMLTATASVVGRWHTELHLGPYETYIRTAAEETNRRVDATLDAISRLEQRLVATEGKVDYLIERLRHPLRSLRAAVDRRRGDTD